MNVDGYRRVYGDVEGMLMDVGGCRGMYEDV